MIETESGKHRKIPLNRIAYEIAYEMLLSRPKDGIFVFNNAGQSYGSVKRSFNTALRKAGVNHCRFHDFSHTSATKLVHAGVSLPVVKELLEHSTIETTMRYAHPTPDNKRTVVEMRERQSAIVDRHYLDTKPKSVTPPLVVTPCK